MKKSKENYKFFLKKLFFPTVVFVLLVVFNAFIYKLFSVRALAFGCFDDCANYMAGYFMKHGKTLYSEIFYNHIMGMAHISYLIQKLHDSINLYDLVLTHRKFIMLSSFTFSFLLILRFKWAAVLFVIFYELTKFYVFGDRFLAESIVVYASVYMLGLVYEKLNNKNLSRVDYLFAGFLVFFIGYLREPYIPLAVFLFIILLWGKINRVKIFSVIIPIFLTLLVFTFTPFKDFIFNDFTVNLQTAIKGEAQSKSLLGLGIFQMFLNPLYILFSGKVNLFRLFQVSLSVAFIVGIVYQIKIKKWFLSLIIILILGIANIRIIEPGTMYYEAYHSMVWYGLFIFITCTLILEIMKKHFKTGVLLLLLITVGWGLVIFSPSSYIYDKIDQQETLLTNFGTVMNVGNVIRELSNKEDTLFLDGADDMIYWQSERFSSYPYSWYTSVMPAIPTYTKARLEMFKNNAPTFYYDYCSKDAAQNPSLPEFVRNKYQQLYSNGNPSCLYVLKTKLKKINTTQWEKAKEGFYTLPEE